MEFKLKKGLDIPIAGQPEQVIHDHRQPTAVAVLGGDYVGLRPSMLVREGDRVRLGQSLFTNKKNPGVTITSPGTGMVTQINRGEKRTLQSVVIKLDGDEEEVFKSYSSGSLTDLGREQIKKQFVDSGLWNAFRTRPYSKVPRLDSLPRSIFVTAMDSNPLAARADIIIKEHATDFVNGLVAISRLTDGKTYVCADTGAELPRTELPNIETAFFSGPNPAGLVGTHIHFIDPVGSAKTVWYIGYQDVIAAGKLFTTGRLWIERVIALAGPIVNRPRLVRTRLGASVADLVKDELESVDSRVISGSILSGRRAVGPVSYLGRYHQQVCALREGREREFFGWLKPGVDKFSAINVFVSSILRNKTFSLTTSQNGSPRAMVPIGNYEEVMPLDILPTQLLRALVVGDTDTAQALGCLELDEEDLALCSFVCASKYNYGPVLRDNLTQIEKEG